MVNLEKRNDEEEGSKMENSTNNMFRVVVKGLSDTKQKEIDKIGPDIVFLSQEIDAPDALRISNVNRIYDALITGGGKQQIIVDPKCIDHIDGRDVYITAIVIGTVPSLPNINHTSIPKEHLMPNDPLTNALVPKTGEGEFEIVLARRPKTIISYALIEVQDPNVKMSRKFTTFDRSVFNAICSLWNAGNEIITADMVWRTMGNKTNSEKVTEPKTRQITESIEKMSKTYVECDVSQHLQAGTFKDDDGRDIDLFQIKAPIISIEEIVVGAGGYTKKAYKLTSSPVLLRYAKATRQLISVDADYMNIRRVKNGTVLNDSPVANTSARHIIREYCIRRISIIKKDVSMAKKYNQARKQSDHILFDAIFAEMDDKGLNRTKKARVKDYVELCLDYWKAIGFISNYEWLEGDRNSVRGFSVKVLTQRI